MWLFLKKVSHLAKKTSNSENFFDALSGAWEDGTSVEEEMKYLYSAILKPI